MESLDLKDFLKLARGPEIKEAAKFGFRAYSVESSGKEGSASVIADGRHFEYRSLADAVSDAFLFARFVGLVSRTPAFDVARLACLRTQSGKISPYANVREGFFTFSHDGPKPANVGHVANELARNVAEISKSHLGTSQPVMEIRFDADSGKIVGAVGIAHWLHAVS